jgi:hypothetical protein
MTEYEEFYQHVARTNKIKDCWEWQRCLSSGYGKLIFRGRLQSAHRVSYLLEFGSIPPGAFICHHCDNRRCVNPTHLYAGTASMNSRDAVRRQRTRNGREKLTQEQADEIRQLNPDTPAMKHELSERFGVPYATIAGVVAGKTYVPRSRR